MKEISIGRPGSEFGNLALDDDSGDKGLRRATVVSLEDTNFIVLDKDSYQRIIGADRKKRRYKLTSMLENSHLFIGCPKQILNSFYIFAEFEKFRMGQTIMKWGQQAEKMYMIFEGSAMLVRPKLDDTDKIDLDRLLAGVDTSKEVVKGDPMLARSYKLQVVTEDICIRGPGMSFGEEFVVLKTKTEYKAMAHTEEVIVVTISAEVIQKKLFQFMPSCKLDFEDAVRERWRLGYPWKKSIEKILKKGLSQVDIFKNELKKRRKGGISMDGLNASNIGNFVVDPTARPFVYERDIGVLCKYFFLILEAMAIC